MGRRLTLPIFVMTLVSSWYGGIFGVSEYTYSYGVSNWIIFGLPYTIFGIIFALIFAKKAHQSNVFSIPELLGKRHKSLRSMSAIWVFILSSPAPYIVGIGLFIQFYFGIQLHYAIIIGTVISTLYIFNGGLASVARTDVIQFILMFLGFFTIIFILSTQYLSPFELFKALPESHTQANGGQSWTYILVWFFIASWTLIDPGFHQRIYATPNPETAKKGILYAVIFWLLFDILTTLTGLYAFHLLPQNSVASLSFLALGQMVLPPGLFGLFVIGLSATIMSTLDSTALISGTTLIHDLFPTQFSHIQSQRNQNNLGIFITLFVGIILAIFLPSIVSLWYTLGTLTIPALLFPVISSYYPKYQISWKLLRLNLIATPLLSFLWMSFAKVDQWHYLFNLEPFYPGIIASIFIWIYAKYSNQMGEI